MEIVSVPEWEEIVGELIRHGGAAILIGATDSGKSTLAKYLTKEMLLKNIYVSLVDSDIGQSSLGIPGTICMRVFKKTEDMDNFEPDKIFFVGDINPARNIPAVIEGTKKMVDIAEAEGVKTILVDTTGLIEGDVGRALKMRKIRAIMPRHIIALQRGNELEHILSLIEGSRIYRLKVSNHAKEKRRKERIEYRHKKYAEYFKGSRTIYRSCGGLEFICNGKEIDIKEGCIEPDRLIGINRDEETIAIGIFKGIRKGKVAIKGKIKSFKDVNRIIVGEII